MPLKQGDAPQSVSPCSMFRISGGSYKNLSILLYLNLPSGDELFGSIMRVCSRRHLSGNSTKFQEVGGNYDHLFGEVIPDGKTDERTTGGKKGNSYRIIRGSSGICSSPHRQMDCNTGISECPVSERQYSTFGGTPGYS